MFEVNIYLETSLKGPVVKDGWYAAVLEYISRKGETVTREDFGRQSSMTYHQQTMYALLESLKRLNASCVVNIYSDSSYVEGVLKTHLKTWKSNGFINAKGEPVKDNKEWREIAKLISGHKIIFRREKRHAYSAWMQQTAKIIPIGTTKTENKAIRNLENTECKRIWR